MVIIYIETNDFCVQRADGGYERSTSESSDGPKQRSSSHKSSASVSFARHFIVDRVSTTTQNTFILAVC